MNKIITHPATPEYRMGWDRIFGGNDAQQQRKENNDVVSGNSVEYVPENRSATIDAPGRPTHGMPVTAPGRGVFGRDGT